MDLNISLDRKSQRVNMTQKDGTVKVYVLKEMMGDQRDAYLQGAKKRIKVNKDGSASMDDFVGFQAELICRCIYDEGETAVPLDAIKTWPASAQDALFNACQAMNGLDKGGEDAEKNS